MTAEFNKLGIIAGGGSLPTTIVDACRQEKKPYHVLAIDGAVSPDWLAEHPHSFIQLGTLKATISILENESCDAVMMVGNVVRPNFKNLKVDMLGARLLPQVALAARKGDDALLRFLVTQFEKFGFSVIGADDVMLSLLVAEGCLTQKKPSEQNRSDIEKAFEVVRTLGAMDIGQAAAVCRGLVLAVEAAEGTDAMLARCAALPSELLGTPDARDGVLVKAKKPSQERRTDLPVIGVETVRRAAEAGFAGIAVEAGNALALEREQLVSMADDLGLFVIGYAPGQTA